MPVVWSSEGYNALADSQSINGTLDFSSFPELAGLADTSVTATVKLSMKAVTAPAVDPFSKTYDGESADIPALTLPTGIESYTVSYAGTSNAGVNYGPAASAPVNAGAYTVASDSLAVTVEGFCYMPGYGIASAATTLVGQSIGAGRKDLSRRFAYLSVALGMGIMAFTGALMFLLAPWMFSLLTPDPAIQALGSQVLRIEAFAEPLFAASIVAAGALRGAGDTLAPSIMNLVSMWGVRLTAAMLLAPRFGLPGVWAAMCGELCIRGILFLIRLVRGKWLEGRNTEIALEGKK